MDYRAAARFRATKLSDLIAEEMLAGGEGFFKASKKAISAKSRARLTGIKQKFDPLNLASALLGRSRLGTTLVGKLFGRSAEDITYFAGDRGRSARPIRKFRYKNPLISSISSGDTSPSKRSDGLANIFGKIYNTMLKNFEERKRLKEIEDNFKEEQLEEDERRHEELIDAITGEKTVVASQKEDKQNIFKMLLDMINQLKDMVSKFAKWVVESLGVVGKTIGQNLLKALSSELAPFLGIQAAVAGAQVYFVGKEQEKAAEAAKKGNAGEVIEAERRSSQYQMGIGSEFADPTEQAAAARQSARSDLQAAAAKGSEEAKIALKRMDAEDAKKEKAAEYVKALGYDPNLDNLALSEKPGIFGGSISRKEVEDAYNYADGKIGLPKKTKIAPQTKPSSSPKVTPAQSTSSSSSSATPSTVQSDSSMSSPMPPPPSPVSSASSQNMSLQVDEKTSGGSTQPVVVNNTGTSIPKKSNEGIPPSPATVRDEELMSPLVDSLRRVYYQ